LVVFYSQYFDEVREFMENLDHQMMEVIQMGESGVNYAFVDKANPAIVRQVTAIDDADLISFGNYLLSDERTRRKLSGVDIESKISNDDLLGEVSHADVANWKASQEIVKGP
jgi:hypothetical protein